MDDRGLQHERTELGWRRTGLAAVALTVAFLRARIDELDGVAVFSIAATGAIVLVILTVILRLPNSRAGGRDGRIPAAVVGLVAVIAIAQLAAIVVT